MVCCGLGTESLLDTMLAYYQLGSWEQIAMILESEFYHFHLGKFIWKCRLPKWRPFCPGVGWRGWIKSKRRYQNTEKRYTNPPLCLVQIQKILTHVDGGFLYDLDINVANKIPNGSSWIILKCKRIANIRYVNQTILGRALYDSLCLGSWSMFPGTRDMTALCIIICIMHMFHFSVWPGLYTMRINTNQLCP